jgi:hypothetical protein
VGIVLHQHLGGRDPLVTGTKDLVDLRAFLSTVSHGSDSLRTTSLQDTADTDELRNVQHFRRNGPVLSGRSGEDDGTASCNLGRNTQVQSGGWQNGGSTGNVDTDSINRAGESSADNAGHGLDDQRLGFRLTDVESLEVCVGAVNGITDLFRQDIFRDRFRGVEWRFHNVGLELYLQPVELLRE